MKVELSISQMIILRDALIELRQVEDHRKAPMENLRASMANDLLQMFKRIVLES